MIGAYLTPDGAEEYAVTFDRSRSTRLLVLPALFDEGNKLRHFTIEVMRRLDTAGIDTFLPDLPGCNESLAPLEQQSLSRWRAAAAAAGTQFHASHGLSIRGGALCEPADMPCIRYATATGASLQRGLLRARLVSSKEAGVNEDRDTLLSEGRIRGLELAGFRIGAELFRELEQAEPHSDPVLAVAQSDLGGASLWLRAEPSHSPEQADKLATIIGHHLS